MVTFLTTPHVNIEAYAMHVTSNHTLNSEPSEVQCGGFKGQKWKFLVEKKNEEFIALQQIMVCIAFSAGVIYRIYV